MKILSSGIATIQDSGRFGYRNWGINNSGCMDESSAWLCNMLVANDHNDAVVEISGGEFSITPNQALLLACGGKGYTIFKEKCLVGPWQPFALNVGETLRIRPDGGGIFYLAVHGGIRTPSVLDSRSTHLQAGFGGLEGRHLKAGDHVNVSVLRTELGEKIFSYVSRQHGAGHLKLSPQAIPDFGRTVIRFFAAHEYHTFEKEAMTTLLSENFQLGKYISRMGYRFSGLPMYQYSPVELTSTAVVPGTMQVTPDGQLLVLMTDAQTAGGYPRIGQVCRVDLALLAQQTPESVIRFRMITEEKAESIFLAQQQAFISLQKDYALYFS